MIDANQPTDSATAPTASEATGAHIPAEDVAHRADDLVAGAPLKLGDFRIIREVGRGGMGVVFEAEEAALGRHVALKVMRSEMAMNPAARKRFLREARAMAAA